MGFIDYIISEHFARGIIRKIPEKKIMDEKEKEYLYLHVEGEHNMRKSRKLIDKVMIDTKQKNKSTRVTVDDSFF